MNPNWSGRSLERHYAEDLAILHVQLVKIFGRSLAIDRQRGIEQVLFQTQSFNSSHRSGIATAYHSFKGALVPSCFLCAMIIQPLAM